MQVLQRIHDSKIRAQVQVQGRMSNRREIHKHHTAGRFLQRDRRIHCGRRSAGPALCIQHNKDSSAPGNIPVTASRSGKAGERFQQRIPARRPVKIFACPGAHGRHNGSGLGHFADRKNRRVVCCRVDEFDGAGSRAAATADRYRLRRFRHAGPALAAVPDR